MQEENNIFCIKEYIVVFSLNIILPKVIMKKAIEKSVIKILNDLIFISSSFFIHNSQIIIDITVVTKIQINLRSFYYQKKYLICKL